MEPNCDVGLEEIKGPDRRRIKTSLRRSVSFDEVIFIKSVLRLEQHILCIYNVCKKFCLHLVFSYLLKILRLYFYFAFFLLSFAYFFLLVWKQGRGIMEKRVHQWPYKFLQGTDLYIPLHALRNLRLIFLGRQK